MKSYLLPEVTALLAALFLSLTHITFKKALKDATAYMGTVVVALVPILLLGPWVASRVRIEAISWEGSLWYFLSGLVHPALAITFLLLGTHRVGVARTSAITSMSPFVSVIIGIVFMGERPGWTIWLGGSLIVGGIVTVLVEKLEGRVEIRKYLFPLLAGISFGLAPALRKSGLVHIPDLSYGVVVAALGGLVGLALIAPIFPKGQKLNWNRKGLITFILAAFIALIGRFLIFDSLLRGEFSRITFLINTTPLFALILSAIFLKKSERITLRLVTATCIVVLGICTITMSA